MHNGVYDLQIPSYKPGLKVLDYGFGNGNLVSKIDPQDYTGLEADRDAYDYCRQRFPSHNFLHQDIYSPAYNPNGSQYLPVLKEKYDVIFAYSVFTHTSYEYFCSCIDIFKKSLNAGGSIYVSMITFENQKLIDYFTQKRNRQFGSCDEIAPTSNFVYLVENKVKAEVTNAEYVLSIYKREFLEKHGTLVRTSMHQDVLSIET